VTKKTIDANNTITFVAKFITNLQIWMHGWRTYYIIFIYIDNIYVACAAEIHYYFYISTYVLRMQFF